MKTKAFNIYEFSDYKPFLLLWFQRQQTRIKGVQTRFAKSIGCNPPYVSHVLNGKSHLSLEQALSATKFLGLDALESQYFLNLVQAHRAGTSDLRSYFQAELTKIKGQTKNLQSRLGLTNRLRVEHEKKYYSHWVYAAVHIGLFIPAYEFPDTLAQALQLPRAQVLTVLHFLESAGLADKIADGKYRGKNPDLHLSKDSDLVQQHHMHWRQRAVRDPILQRPKDLHYSLVMAIAKKDREHFQEMFLRLIESTQARMSTSSPEDCLFGFNLDFFELTQD